MQPFDPPTNSPGVFDQQFFDKVLSMWTDMREEIIGEVQLDLRDVAEGFLLSFPRER